MNFWKLGILSILLAGPVIGSHRIVLKDGSFLNAVKAPVLEKHMLALKTTEGVKLLLSQRLVDWEATWRYSPEIVSRFQPGTAEKMALQKAARKRNRPKQEIAITNESLDKLKPGQGLASHWEGDRELLQARGRTATPTARPVSNTPIIKTITKGERVQLTSHLETNRYVIFDFYADWCGPCRHLTPRLEALVRKYPRNVALKKVDIVNWGTPVARQYSINSIPHLRLYGPSGKKVMSGSGRSVIKYLERRAKKENW